MRLLIFILLIAPAVASAQHIPVLSQYMFNDVALNPANTGNQNALSLFGNFRAQWIGIPGAPTTYSFTAHSPLKNVSSSVGVQFFADKIGVDQNTGVFGNYAYRIKMKKSSLSFGVAGGIMMVKSNGSKLNVNDTGDQLLADSPLGIMPDVSFGLSLNGEKYFVTFSIPMFLSHKFDGNKIRLYNDFSSYNFMLGGGVAIKMGESRKLRPSVLLKYKPGARIQADINIMAELHKIFEAGLSYRTEESIIALLKFNPTKQFSIMYSFGMPLSSISYRQYGSHEIGLRYNFLYKTNMSNARYLGW